MTRDSPSGAFQEEWEAFLVERGHTFGRLGGIQCVLRSNDPSGKGYRWLLVLASGKSKTLSEAERADIKHHLRRARKLGQKAYLVIRFNRPERKVLVLPAYRALEKKRILPRKGGIPWVD